MEVGRLQHYVLRRFIGTTALAAKHAGYTHGLLGITDSQVAVRELVLYPIQRLERRTVGHRLHHNLVPLHHIGIEAMQRLTQGHHDIVGDINNIIDRTQADDVQALFQPLWRLLDLAVRDAHTSIATTSLRVLYLHLDRQAHGCQQQTRQ